MTAAQSRLHAGLGAVLATVMLLAAGPALAASYARDEAPRHFRLAAQTADATIWAEDCEPGIRMRGRSAMRDAALGRTLPQPDPEDLSALMSALRQGDFAGSGVRIVETGDGPMLRRAGSRPGAPASYFMLCNVAIGTSYE